VNSLARIVTMFRSSGRAGNDSVRASRGAEGAGAPSSRRLRATLAVLALSLVASLAITATASATRIGAITNVSYSSAVIGAKVTASGLTQYNFEYSTNNGTTWSSGPIEQVFSNNGDVPIEPTLGGLRGGTTYAIRLAVSGVPTAPAAPPYPEFTTLAVEPPTIIATNDASAVFSTSASFTGKVKRPANSDPAFNISACRFEVVPDAEFVTTGFQGATVEVCEPSTPYKQPNGETEVSAHLSGLSPATTYHLRLAVENAAPGTVTKEATHTFTTAAKVAVPIILATNAPNELKVNGGNVFAKFSGEVQRPLGEDPALDVNCRFEFVTDAKFNANAPGERFAGAEEAPCAQNPITKSSGNAEGKLPVSAEVFGLVKPGTTYHLQLVAENTSGVVAKEAASTFTTLPPKFPVFTVNPATAGYVTAEVSGTVNPEGGAISNGNFMEWYFQYSTEPGNPNSWVYSSAAGYFYSTEETPIPVSGTITGLKPGTKYYLRLYANNYLDIQLPSGEPYVEFTTKGTSALPSVTLEPVSGITVNSAHFSGFVNTNAPAGPLDAEAKAAYKTEWHVECTPGCPGLSGTVEAEEGGKAIGGTVERLEGNTFYENVKLVAHNELGTVETPARSFQTELVLPEVKATPGGSAGKGSYNVGGIVTPFNSKIINCQFEYGPTTEYVYSAPCTPNPVGRNEVQRITVLGLVGQFKLIFRGQTTENINQSAPPAVVESELKALSAIGPEGVTEVERAFGFFATEYTIHFSGPLSSQNVGPIRGIEGTLPLCNDQSTCHLGDPGNAQTLVEGGNNVPVLVEAHLTGLTPGATYHYKLVASNSLGTVSTDDQVFVPPLAANESACPNEQERIENSSTRLPECRAYELVTNRPKGGFSASLAAFSNNEKVGYRSNAGNIEESGEGNFGGNFYLAERTDNGWATEAHLNGPKGTPYYPRGSLQRQGLYRYSPDLERSLWFREVEGKTGAPYLREANGEFIPISEPPQFGFGAAGMLKGESQDLSHTFWIGTEIDSAAGLWAPDVGLGIYEYAGTNNIGPPREVDVKDDGKPISECVFGGAFEEGYSNFSGSSSDGKAAFVTIKACEGHAQQVWARVDASKTYFVSESQCTRIASDPGGACYTPVLTPGPYGEAGPADAIFESVIPDGSRVFFTTSQQLINGDTNKSSDLYRYELPSVSNPNPSPTLINISSGGPNAQVKSILRTSEDGSTVYFVAKGVLASNQDALGETAHDGDENMYVWNQNGSQPEGTTTFIGRLDESRDVYIRSTSEITPDGRYFLFRTYYPMTPNDTDNAADVYRYDDVTGELLRVSVGTSGTGGNGDGFDAEIPQAEEFMHPSITDDGQEIVFATSEALSADDGNGAPDVYIWKDGHTALLSTGSVGGGATAADIDASGKNIYFESSQQLSQEDTDSVSDVYDARIDGGVSFARVEKCTGEACQPQQSGVQPTPTPGTGGSNGAGNYQRATVSITSPSPSQLAKLASGKRVGLNVTVSGGGKLSLKGMGLIGKKQKLAFAATRRTVQAGQVQVPVSLGKSALAHLRNAGSLKLQLSAEFADATPSTTALTLKAPRAATARAKQQEG
jgi:Tol biopolymer transport system component